MLELDIMAYLSNVYYLGTVFPWYTRVSVTEVMVITDVMKLIEIKLHRPKRIVIKNIRLSDVNIKTAKTRHQDREEAIRHRWYQPLKEKSEKVPHVRW